MSLYVQNSPKKAHLWTRAGGRLALHVVVHAAFIAGVLTVTFIPCSRAGAPANAHAPVSPTPTSPAAHVQPTFVHNMTYDVCADPEGIVRRRGPDGADVAFFTEKKLQSVLHLANTLGTPCRIVPAFENGKAIGFKLFSVQAGSIYDRLGLKNGDIVKAINGYDLTTPEKGPGAFAAMRDDDRFAVEVRRNGDDVLLNMRRVYCAAKNQSSTEK